jgi:hypothetical protein
MAPGRVRTHQAAVPAGNVLSTVSRDEVHIARSLIYSQVWRHFTIARVHSSLEQLKCHVRAAPPKLVAEQKALTGFELVVALHPGLPAGPFEGRIDVEVAPDSSGALQHLHLEVQGSVQGDISIFGADFDRTGCLRLGVLAAESGASCTLAILVRGHHRDLTVRRIECWPEFLKAKLTRPKQSGERLTRYTLHIEIPRAAPVGDYRGTRRGWVVLYTDHPAHPEIPLSLDFAVAPSSGFDTPALPPARSSP